MSNPKDNRLEQLEELIGIANRDNALLSLRFVERGQEIERISAALSFVIGWMIHHKHGGEIRIPSVDIREEKECYTFETFPDVTTGEIIYKAIYDPAKRDETPDEDADSGDPAQRLTPEPKPGGLR